MKDLIFKHPIKIKQTTIYKGESLDNPNPVSYCRFCTVFTQLGIVTVLDFEWKNNFGVDKWTEFSTILDGEIWRAELKEGKLNDFRIKWMATHFIKTVFIKYTDTLDLDT